MASKPSPSSGSSDLKLALLQAILEAQAPYPWQPLAPDGQSYFEAQENQGWADGDLIEADLQPAWQALKAEAEACWAITSNHGFGSHLLGALAAQFGQQVPLPLLTQLGQQLETLVSQGDALIDRMVAAAITVLEDWDADDLRVVARPLALAMRDGNSVEAVTNSLGDRPWSTLSEVEKARLSLAIARYGFDYLEQQS